MSVVEIAKPVYLEKADAVCEDAYQRVRGGFQAFTREHGEDAFDDPSLAEAFATTVLIPAKRQQVRELRALGAPQADQEQVEAILDAYEEGIEMAEDDPEAAVTSAFGVFTQATERAEAYGLESCRY